nr:hypothetical protein [candidate division Zixibacteria bacterium]
MIVSSPSSPAQGKTQTGIFGRIPPWVTLLALAPILGELVSSHQTPLEFVNPFNLLILSLPYGCGALICRELLIRWSGSALSLLLLGLAFGVYEEGVVVYSLFDPDWSELGPLATYGFRVGVNWTWSIMTIQFHALISIGSSVVLAHIIHSDRRNQAWLGKRGLIACGAGLLAWIPVLGLIMKYDMHRPFPQLYLYLLAWGVVLGLVFAAYRLAIRQVPSVKTVRARPWFFFVLGLINITVVFSCVFITAEYGFPPLGVTLLSLVLFDAISLALVWRWSGHTRGWDDRHRLALIAGLLVFFVFFAFTKDFESWHGTSIIGILTIMGLWQLGRTVHRKRQLSGYTS